MHWMAPRNERLFQQVLGLGCCCKLTSERKQWQRYCMGAKDDTPTLGIHTRNVGAQKCGPTWHTIRIFLNHVKCRNQWRNHKTICAGGCLCGWRPLVLWCPSDDMTMQALTIETPMANKCKNLGKQVQTTYHDWTDDVEPVLPTPPVHKDSYEWNPWADCIYPAEYSDEPIEPMESPTRGWLKNLTKSLALIRYLFTLSLLVQATKLIFLPKDVV
jgi:hypothetical protein